ncbi:hypothetical protein BST81_02695 [Leptolyngbya sp. 'hensonii']|nr:hypothetical protein BST81_02695 [Leptolyngbya sp. 'hensonii']
MIESNLLTAELDTPLPEVIRLLDQSRQAHAAGCVVAVDQGEVVGIFTEWDAVRLAVSRTVIESLKMTDVMVRPVITIADTELHNPLSVLSLFYHQHIHHLPIVDQQGKVLGLISSNSVQQGLQPTNLLKLYRIENILDTSAVTATPDTPILQLAQLMTDHRVSHIVIVHQASEEQTIPIGMVTAHHILHGWLQGSNLEEVEAQTIMETPATTLKPWDSLWLVFQEMQQRQLPCLIVTDDQENLLGLVTQFNLLQILNPAEMHRYIRNLQESIHSLEAEKMSLLRSHALELERLVQTRTAQLSELYEQLQHELAERKQAEAALQKANEELERRVEERIALWQQANEKLQTGEAKFRNLVEQTNDWVWEIDQTLNFIYVNPRVEQITGYTAEEVLSRRIFDFMPADEAVRLTTVLEYVVAQRESFSQIETVLLHQAGHRIVLEISGAPVFSSSGEWQGYRGITRDITERKQVERNIRKALTREKELNELKTRFVAMASHEFRTPLTTILASAECLEHYSNKWSEEKKQVALQRIQGAAKHMTDLLNDVLILGKAEAGKLEFKPIQLNLQEFCADLVEEVQLGTNSSCRLNFTWVGNPIGAWVDEKLLRHILVNLLSNALKYSAEGSRVNFRLNCQDDIAVFQIEDHGIGIPLEDQKCLFEPFQRATNVGNIAGTGLGLVIVKKAVEAHGGTIKFDSVAGVGTTFTVCIPSQR